MDTILTFLFEVILIFPGACIRWLLGGCKKKYHEYLEPDMSEVNALIAILTFALLYFIIYSVFVV